MSTPTKITFLYDNIITAAMASVDDGHTSDFLVANLVDEDVSTVTRTRDETGAKTWTIDLGSNTTFDTFGIAGHNFSSSGTFAWGSGTSSPPSTDAVTMTDNHFIHYLAAAVSHRYIKFTSSETTGDGYHEIGEMWIGSKVELTRNPHIPIKIIREKNETSMVTGGGQKWSYDNYQSKGYEMSFIDNVSTTQFASMETIHNDRKFSKPYFFNLAPADSNDTVLFVRTVSWDFDIDGKDMRPGNWAVIEEK